MFIIYVSCISYISYVNIHIYIYGRICVIIHTAKLELASRSTLP